MKDERTSLAEIELMLFGCCLAWVGPGIVIAAIVLGLINKFFFE